MRVCVCCLPTAVLGGGRRARGPGTVRKTELQMGMLAVWAAAVSFKVNRISVILRWAECGTLLLEVSFTVALE